MKSYSSREVLQILKADGWYEVNCEESHHQFTHPVKKGRVTVKNPVNVSHAERLIRQSELLFR